MGNNSNVTHKFVIRNNIVFVRYAKCFWGYFLRHKTDGIKIVIRKDNVFIHISQAYSIILNDLEFMIRNPEKYKVEASKSALNWLSIYR